MEKPFATVTAATGALGPVLVKLNTMLGDENKLQEGTRRDIMSIISELQPVHDLLVKLWGREDLDVACQDWMTEARELSYDMEDDIDRFTLGLERGDDGGFIQQETTDSPFKGFMEGVKGVSKRCFEMQGIADAITCNRSKLTTDPRALFLHKDASDLVGMKEKKQKLIHLLRKHEMVCIFGSAGMGKTTLADLVYQAIGDQFQSRAFVSVHPSPNMMDVLGTIHSQVADGAMSSAGSGTELAVEQSVINDISVSLYDKRYLVIIDDIWLWEEWEVIRKALPTNNLGCKLIMTTRIESIAEKCQTEEGAHVYKQCFGYVDAGRLLAMRLNQGRANSVSTSKILDMCGVPPQYYCPLAIICLSSAWIKSHLQAGDDNGQWDTWVKHLLDRFLSCPSLKPLVQSLDRGFNDLPIDLKTCLLYCTIYSPRCRIDRGCLVRKWIAEGFVSQEEVAEAYLEDLVSRNLLKQHIRLLYIAHPIMRAFLVCKAKEENFIAYNGPGNSSHAKRILRLSLRPNCGYLDEDDVSHTRSLVVSGEQCHLYGVSLKKFQNLRVLEINSSRRLKNGNLVDICGLIWLKYLGLIDCRLITELPREIGRLQNLETLFVTGTNISKLPMEMKNLERLETLNVS